MKTTFVMALLLLAGCAETQDTKCNLIFTAYAEQDTLAGSWYDQAAKSCGILHAKGCRGRDASGNYNADKKECK